MAKNQNDKDGGERQKQDDARFRSVVKRLLETPPMHKSEAKRGESKGAKPAKKKRAEKGR